LKRGVKDEMKQFMSFEDLLILGVFTLHSAIKDTDAAITSKKLDSKLINHPIMLTGIKL